ncbi:MAG: FecR family protein [Sphingobacteriaceae bacterium]|nr:MAG: FecR family protein [Sphingobacteriaceae bacterium]
MEKRVPTTLLDKYLNGSCDPEEEAAVKEWYNSFVNDNDHVSSFNSMQKIDLKLRIKRAIDENIELMQKTSPEPVQAKSHTIKYLAYTITGIAAMLVLVFGLKLLNTSGNTAVNSPRELISITNNTKSIQEQVLSDGSHVWLYPGAQIEFSKKFTGNTREVRMTGESFFDVAKDASKPFVIHTEHMVTKVWGTSFRVRDSKASGFVDVTVVTGKVSVTRVNAANGPQKEVMLHPNEQVTWVKKHNVLKTNKEANSKDLTIWYKINLSFDNSPVKDVIPVLNKQFNVNIISTDEELNNYLLDADFNGLNFVSVMEILKKTLNISYEMNNTTIILKNNNQ